MNGSADPEATKKTNQSAAVRSAWEKAKEEMRNSESAAVKSAWEKAREETRKKEEENKKAEEARRKEEELRKQKEEEDKERIKRREKFTREREARERERREKEKEKELREKTDPPKPVAQPSVQKADLLRPPSPTKRHQQPTAKTTTERDTTYSFRPYDKPKRPPPTAASASSIYSESSYAPSYSTSQTTPPPSVRGPYQSKDPDKIVLRAVYSFNNAFIKTPIAQLVSGVGSVTDGLILRITTEGLFIDDDVRGVPQREWDIKAWTLKLLEVWCPHLHTSLGASSGSIPATAVRTSGFFGGKGRATAKAPSSEESDEFVNIFMRVCEKSAADASARTTVLGDNLSNRSASSQTGESKGLHVLRANIRDQEGKRYVFVMQADEGWKVAVGLQRLRRGTQVRALGVSGMSAHESKGILENIGWAS